MPISVYDKLIQFQKLPDAFADWQAYRTAVSAYIIAHTATGSSLAVFGAGHCSDLDLAMLAGHFSAVTLLDADRQAMDAALSSYHQTGNPLFHLIQSEFSGITAADYRAFADSLSALLQVRGKDTDIMVLADFAVHALHGLYRKAANHTLDFGENTFDYSMAFGLHSQINNMAAWIWSAFCANLDAADASVEQLIIQENEKLIPRLNDAILRATKKTAFFGCELANTARAGRIQGACQCIDDLTERGIVTEQAVVYWPFDLKQEVIYQMLIQQADCR